MGQRQPYSKVRNHSLYAVSLDAAESLAYWKKLLDDDMFFLVNKSIIVNIKKVEQFSNNNISLKGIEQEIPLSRDRKSEFKQKLLLYLAGQE